MNYSIPICYPKLQSQSSNALGQVPEILRSSKEEEGKS